MTRQRIDALLVARGLFDSRARARAAIEAGGVRVAGRIVRKPAEMIDHDAEIAAEAPHPWVSRGGLKLDHALTAFGIDPAGRVCLDLGASTGGFTHVLLARGAARVVAVDVGTGQLHPSLHADPRVTALERTDAREVTPALLGARPSLLVADLSFISLDKAIGPALLCLTPAADIVLLVKPQFEAGPARVGKGGVVADDIGRAVLAEVRAGLEQRHGLSIAEVIDSPITGADGNREFLLYARAGG